VCKLTTRRGRVSRICLPQCTTLRGLRRVVFGCSAMEAHASPASPNGHWQGHDGASSLAPAEDAVPVPQHFRAVLEPTGALVLYFLC
jgi:hypothetical protein